MYLMQYGMDKNFGFTVQYVWHTVILECYYFDVSVGCMLFYCVCETFGVILIVIGVKRDESV